jgi:hypothetical protein
VRRYGTSLSRRETTPLVSAIWRRLSPGPNLHDKSIAMNNQVCDVAG